MHLVDVDLSQRVCLLVCEDFGLAWVDFEPWRFRTFFEVRDNFLSCFKEFARRQRSVGLIYSLLFHHSVWCPSTFLPKFQFPCLSPLLSTEADQTVRYLLVVTPETDWSCQELSRPVR